MKQLIQLLIGLGALTLLVIIGGIIYAVYHIFGDIVGGIILIIPLFLLVMKINE